MEKINVYVCQSCNTWHCCTSQESQAGCPECKSTLRFVPIDYWAYSGMSMHEKHTFQDEYRANPSAAVAEFNSTHQAPVPETVKSRSSVDVGEFFAGCGGRLVVYFLVGLLILLGTHVYRWFSASNTMQREAHISLNEVIDNGGSMPVGEYVEMEVRWVLGPYAHNTQTTKSFGISATSKKTYYYYLILENGTVMSVSCSGTQETETFDRMSNWLMNVEGYPTDGETVVVRGRLDKLTNTELLKYYKSDIRSIFNLDPESDDVHKLNLDTDAGREAGFLIVIAVIAVLVIVTIVWKKHKKKREEEELARLTQQHIFPHP